MRSPVRLLQYANNNSRPVELANMEKARLHRPPIDLSVNLLIARERPS